jgi:serine/threonine-protein kinase
VGTGGGAVGTGGGAVGTGGGAVGTGGGAVGTGGGQGQGGLFVHPHPWTQDVSGLPWSTRSDDIISALKSLGGWGGSDILQIDFTITLMTADGATPLRPVTVSDIDDYCYGGPDCEALPLQMPLPANGNTEGSGTYACNNADDDCHVLVHDTAHQRLYELYRVTGSAAGVETTGAFIWDLTKQYPPTLRGDQCTSADAAGLPIAALLATPDEVAAGEIPHAVRFILPNSAMKMKAYVRPATHAGAPSSDNPNAPPYGVRFRLKASFDETPYNAAERVVLRALKKYGMILSDGGQVPLTFGSDRLSTHKWADLGIAADSFEAVTVDDFEVVDLGEEITLTYDCVRNP